MLVALETYLKEDHAAVWKEWEGRCHRITQALKDIQGRADGDRSCPRSPTRCRTCA